MTVHLTYFASLRDDRGLSEETVQTSAATYRELYEELAARHTFRLPVGLVGVAANGVFGALEDSVGDGDRIVFIPPVAGG